MSRSRAIGVPIALALACVFADVQDSAAQEKQRYLYKPPPGSTRYTQTHLIACTPPTRYLRYGFAGRVTSSLSFVPAPAGCVALRRPLTLTKPPVSGLNQVTFSDPSVSVKRTL